MSPEQARGKKVDKRTDIWALPWAVAALAIIGGMAAWNLKPVPPTAAGAPAHLTIALPPGDHLADTSAGTNLPLAFSPDGTHLVYLATRGGVTQLYLRDLDNPEAKPIPGTEGAAAPFFSPDGQWIGFFAQGKLKKVSIAGGAPLTLCDSGGNAGASWAPDDTIIFSPST